MCPKYILYIKTFSSALSYEFLYVFLVTDDSLFSDTGKRLSRGSIDGTFENLQQDKRNKKIQQR